jgi:predicted transcriptional regulator
VKTLGKNRDRLSIVAAILEAANHGSAKTHIMFSANLSFNLLEKYLDLALDAGFVVIEGSKYKLTEHGRDFLKRYKHFEERYIQVQELLESLGGERDTLTRFFEKSKLLESFRPVVEAE